MQAQPAPVRHDRLQASQEHRQRVMRKSGYRFFAKITRQQTHIAWGGRPVVPLPDRCEGRMPAAVDCTVILGNRHRFWRQAATAPFAASSRDARRTD